MLSAKWQKEKLDYNTGVQNADSRSDGNTCPVTSQNGFSIQKHFKTAPMFNVSGVHGKIRYAIRIHVFASTREKRESRSNGPSES